jgi:Cdc6-like AAA superfamily ATPase
MSWLGYRTIESKKKQRKGKLSKRRINSLFPRTTMEAEHLKLRDKYLKGIGCWFSKTQQYQRWSDGDCSTLVCPGIPGSGKTMLASEAVSRLDERSRKQDVKGPIGVAFAYLNANFGGDHPTFELMKQLLAQLVETCPWSDRMQDIGPWIDCTALSLDAVTKLAHRVGRSYSQVYILIDALDELNSAQKGADEAIASLQDLQENFGAKLLFTLRNVPDVIEQLREDDRINIQAEEGDVSKFVDRELQNIDSQTLRDDLKKSIMLLSRNM